MRAICKLLPANEADGNEHRLLTPALQRACEDVPALKGEIMISAGPYEVATDQSKRESHIEKMMECDVGLRASLSSS